MTRNFRSHACDGFETRFELTEGEIRDGPIKQFCVAKILQTVLRRKYEHMIAYSMFRLLVLRLIR